MNVPHLKIQRTRTHGSASIPQPAPLKEFHYNAARVELINPIATAATATYQGADVDWYSQGRRYCADKDRSFKAQPGQKKETDTRQIVARSETFSRMKQQDSTFIW